MILRLKWQRGLTMIPERILNVNDRKEIKSYVRQFAKEQSYGHEFRYILSRQVLDKYITNSKAIYSRDYTEVALRIFGWRGPIECKVKLSGILYGEGLLYFNSKDIFDAKPNIRKVCLMSCINRNSLNMTLREITKNIYNK